MRGEGGGGEGEQNGLRPDEGFLYLFSEGKMKCRHRRELTDNRCQGKCGGVAGDRSRSKEQEQEQVLGTNACIQAAQHNVAKGNFPPLPFFLSALVKKAQLGRLGAYDHATSRWSLGSF